MNDSDCRIDGPCPNHPNNAWAQRNGIDPDLKLLAAIVYAEAWAEENVKEEMYGIASVTERQRKGWGCSTIKEFLDKHKNFSSAYKNGTPRLRLLNEEATTEQILKDAGMNMALAAAQNARAGGVDYSNGACFWDGKDIINPNHAKRKLGVYIPSNVQDFYKLRDLPSPGRVERYYHDSQGRKLGLRGAYSYAYEATAFYGRTIFWQHTAAYLTTEGVKPWV